MDKQRIMAENADIFINFFQKLRKATREYNIAIDDIYNMDKIGAAIGFFYKSRIIVPEKEAAVYSLMDSNRE